MCGGERVLLPSPGSPSAVCAHVGGTGLAPLLLGGGSLQGGVPLPRWDGGGMAWRGQSGVFGA